jgi:histidine ammonia-lyase
MQGIAAWLRSDLVAGELPRHSDRLQDRYSLRCAPHVIGVVADSLPWWRQLIENELNSANDNPLIDGEGEHVMHGGHFYGGHIAMAMDSMKTAIANLADLLDRQLAQLVDTKFNGGLPSNLSGAPAGRQMINHGFKAVQIGVSAWTAEALKQTMPASVFSRSTECHNQDKVSMGTIAARDALRVLTLTEQVGAACLLAAVQGVELRLAQPTPFTRPLSPALAHMVQQVRAEFAPLLEDRALEQELRALIARIRLRHYPLYQESSL